MRVLDCIVLNREGDAVHVGHKDQIPRRADEHTLEKEFAEDIGVTTRTTANYRKLPDALPFLKIGGRVFIPNVAGREWIARRVHHPNPARRAG